MFKILWRNASRTKKYTILNLLGLAVGIAACLLIFIVIHFETSFDTFHKKKNQIYRIVTETKTKQGTNYLSGVPMPTAEELRIDYPEFEVASIFGTGGQINALDDAGKTLNKFDEPDLFFVEPQFFNLFDFGWLYGDQNRALREPNSVVLTQQTAEKYFGSWTNAIGKVLKYNNRNDLKITGILKNMPPNTDLNINIVVSFATLKNTNFKNSLNDNGGNFGNHYCFVRLPENQTRVHLAKELVAFGIKHKPEDHRNDVMVAQPLTDMHYDSRFGNFSGKTFSKDLINALSLIGVFILVIACVNFINLATANAIKRSREVGIRKILGSNRKGLIMQFMSETFIIVLFSVLLAIGLSFLLLPQINHLLELPLSLGSLSVPSILLFLIILILAVTVLSGLYPAILLSAFRPVEALKNKFTENSIKGVLLRRGLVTLQFSISQLLIIATVVILYQMNYLKNFPLGFNKDAVVNVPIPGDSISQSKLSALRNQLLQNSGIKEISYSFASPSDNYYMDNYFKFNNSATKTDFLTQFKWADAEYFKLYDMTFIAGGPYNSSDSVNGYVINETLMKKLNIINPQDAIGKYINIWDDKTKYAPITGVVKDFNVSSLKAEIPPVLMGSCKDFFGTMNIKLATGNINAALTAIERIWNKTFPNDVYEYQFLDEKIAKFYGRESQLSLIYKLFAGIAIFISCLGLYGLVSFITVQRTKEIGIRKILGASVSNIVLLLSGEFTLIIIIAFAIAAPVAWYFMNDWLRAFAYRINLGPAIFLEAVIISILIAWATVGYKTVRAATTNPVKSLRTE